MKCLIQNERLKWHHSLLLMNSFNKTEAAVFSCRVCFLRAFPFNSWYCHFACFYDITLVVQFLNKIHYLQFRILKETDDEGPYHIFQSTNVCRTPRPRSSNVQQNTCRRRQWRVRQCSSCEIIEASCPGQTHRRSPCFARLQVRRLIQHTLHRTSTPRRHVLRLLTGLSQLQTCWNVRWIPFNTQFLLCLLVII